MLNYIDYQIRYDFGHCQQCGACEPICPQRAISILDTNNGLIQINIDNDLCIKCQKCVKICPANRKMNLGNNYELLLKDKQYFFAWNTNNNIRNSSSSGGATKTLVIESLKSGFIDGVYTLRKLDNYPSAQGEFYTKNNMPSYDCLPNSVYHSIIACSNLDKVTKVHRLMIVGTSCQLYALEHALVGKYDELIKICIFCKQQKTLDSTKWIAKAIGHKLPENNHFTVRYRGDGWPGNIRLNNGYISWEKAAGLPFGRRLWTVPGCNICGDPFGIETGADISMMDPWTIRQQNTLGETLVVVHTEIGKKLITETNNLNWEIKQYDTIKPALALQDIWRKRMCVSFFKGNKVDAIVEKAAKAEIKQRKQLQWLLETFPRLPFICYRLLNKIIPHKRDRILCR